MVPQLSREARCALLAQAEPGDLIALADACLSDGASLQVLVGPEVGSVTAQVREPVAADRFLLGDVLACRAEVALADHRGWAMRLGDDRAAVLAAAVLDAEVQAGRSKAREVDALCQQVAQTRQEADLREWAEIAPTIVQFEELT